MRFIILVDFADSVPQYLILLHFRTSMCPSIYRVSGFFNPRVDYPAFLIKAIEIANTILHDPEVGSTFTYRLGEGSVTLKHLQDVEVRLKKPGSSIYGWTDRSKKMKDIFVNEGLKN